MNIKKARRAKPFAGTARYRLAFFLAVSCGCTLLAAGEMEERGKALMADLFARSRGTQLATLQRMELTESGRRPRVRELFLFRRNQGDLPAASLVRFRSPANVANTGLLSVGDRNEGVDQWVYLPAHGRVRRVPAGRQGGRFAGSDFFYEDMRDRPVDLDEHRWMGEEMKNGRKLEKVESRPKDPATSSYARRVYWIDPEKNLPFRIDFFRRSEPEPFKRYRVLETQTVEGLVIVRDSVMKDLESGHQTRMRVLCAEKRDDLPGSLFQRRTLEDPARDRPYHPCADD